tara:strand:+ start:5052 stop:5426 length:375 start_codon:yes stop_codon:yes gene_type:complete
MGNQKEKSIDKEQNSVDEITRRIDALANPLKIINSDDFVLALLKGKSPKYHVKFAAWCRNTLDSPYYQDMADALLSVYAISLLTSSSEFTDEFVKGQANNVLFIGEEMARLSNIDAFTVEEDKN